MLALLVLALALSADAFAAALARGAAAQTDVWGVSWRTGAAFGLAQGLMPLLGVALGAVFVDAFAAVDHWIAFTLLALLGGKLIWDTATGEAGAPGALGGLALLGAAIATSVDAAAAGMTFETLDLKPLSAAATIALVTGAVCCLGVHIGRAAGGALGKGAGLAGGAALWLLGIKVLFDHGALP